MKLNPVLKQLIFIITIAFCFVACENDFSDVGSSIVDNNNFNALEFNTSAIEAKTQKLERVQTNGIPSYSMGIYNDPVYGKTTANILTQLSLDLPDPRFGDNPEIDSVVFTIPYYSTEIEQTSTDNGISTTYELDSVYGNGTINLDVFRSNYYLRSEDPNNDYEAQRYYSNQGDLFEQNINQDELIFSIQDFRPSEEEIVLVSPGEDDEDEYTRYSPALRVKLDNDYFKELIIDREGSSELLSNSNFRNFFRGLYFKTEEASGDGAMSMLDFGAEDANIIIYYKTSTEDSEGETTETDRTYQLNFGSNIVNVYDNELEDLPSEENLCIKGGQGAMAVVDLFTDEAQLDSIRELNWLIREANLTFYVDENQVSESDSEPERLFVYDIKNRRALDDYSFDTSANENNPTTSRLIHLGSLSEDDNGRRYYKIRLTEHVSSLLNRDSTNTKLGLVVSQNVNISGQVRATATEDESIESVPAPAVMSHKGTVLYGTNAPEDKQLKLNIFYTEEK